MSSKLITSAHRRRAKIAGALALAGALLLGGCASSPEAAAPTDGDLGEAALQFVFIKNVQFAGSYFADTNGYWEEEGLEVELLSGGPNLTVEPVVSSGRALVGIAHTAQAVEAINNGADLTIIGAGFQRNPFVLISREDAPIKTPDDLPGKRIGVQALDLPVFEAFLTANDIDKSTFTIVPLQADPSPLVNGELDGIMGFYSNEPNFLRINGVEPHNLLFDDFNYPLMEEVYIVTNKSLEDPVKRAQIIALMRGESRGWSDAVADVDEAARLAVEVYGADLGLDMKQQVLAMSSEVDLVLTDDTRENGLFWMSDDLIAGTVNSLQLGGVNASADMFTNSILEEVYSGKGTD